MASQMIAIGQAIVEDRPWTYLPKRLRRDVATVLDSLVRARAAVGFEQWPCEEHGEVSRQPPASNADLASEVGLVPPETGDDCPGCWRLMLPVAYDSDGLKKLRFHVRAGPVSVKVELEMGAVGPLITSLGEQEHVNRTGCPQTCRDESVSGELACELLGSISVSAAYAKKWNKLALGSYVAGLASALGLIGAMGSVASVADIVESVSGDSFTFEFEGSGPNRGIVYDLGAFALAPP